MMVMMVVAIVVNDPPDDVRMTIATRMVMKHDGDGGGG